MSRSPVRRKPGNDAIPSPRTLPEPAEDMRKRRCREDRRQVLARDFLVIGHRPRLEPVDLSHCVLNCMWAVRPEHLVGHSERLEEEIHMPFGLRMRRILLALRRRREHIFIALMRAQEEPIEMGMFTLKGLSQGILQAEIEESGAAIFSVRGEKQLAMWPPGRGQSDRVQSRKPSPTSAPSMPGRRSAVIAALTASRWPVIGRTKIGALEKATTPIGRAGCDRRSPSASASRVAFRFLAGSHLIIIHGKLNAEAAVHHEHHAGASRDEFDLFASPKAGERDRTGSNGKCVGRLDDLSNQRRQGVMRYAVKRWKRRAQQCRDKKWQGRQQQQPPKIRFATDVAHDADLSVAAS